MRKEAKNYYDKKLATFADKEERMFDRVLPENASNVRKIHLSGICGTAMGSLATLLSKSGFLLTGSDTSCYPPMSNVIESLGIDLKRTFSEDNVKDADLVIIGNVCSSDNPEAKYAREHSIPTLSLAEALHEFFIYDKKSIVVAGTHGKTTTTGLLAHVFNEAKLEPGYMVGGVMQGGAENAKPGEGGYFIIEGDEYDTAYFDKSPKFLHYAPDVAIITSLEFDHADIYKDLEEYTQAFKFLVKEIPDTGTLFLYGDDKNVRALAKETGCEVILYGLERGNDITARNIKLTEKGQHFSLVVAGEEDEDIFEDFFIPLPGRHNLLNTLAVCGVALNEEIPIEDLRDALRTFKGMKRRQEVIAEVKGITIIDDFAHHPTAVKETIGAIKGKYPHRRVVAFFEPRSVTSRRKMFEKDYGNAFKDAELVFISTPEIRSVDDPANFIDPSTVITLIKEGGVEAYSVKNADDLLKIASPLLTEGDVVLIMSNSSFDGIHQKLVNMLKM